MDKKKALKEAGLTDPKIQEKVLELYKTDGELKEYLAFVGRQNSYGLSFKVNEDG